MIWAMSRNRVIGQNNRLPWRLPADMQFFMMTTMGKPVIMGRKTFASMKAPLPGRTNIVVTSNSEFTAAEGVVVVNSLDAALTAARAQCVTDGCDELIVAGGHDIYASMLPQAQRLSVTEVQAEVEGDVHFPALSWDDWRIIWHRDYAADERHDHAFTIAQWERG